MFKHYGTQSTQILTTKDLQKLLNISKSTVYKLLKTKKISSWRIGNQYRICLQDVEAYISQEIIKNQKKTSDIAKSCYNDIDKCFPIEEGSHI